MNEKEWGTPPNGEAPQGEAGLAATLAQDNLSALVAACKPIDPTIFTRYDRKGIEAQLQAYLDLGLTPIPLKSKIPIIRWRHGNWNPRTLADLKPYLNRANWGLRTGGNFCVIDFDTEEAFHRFFAENIDKLPSGTPIVKTGRGYHIWFRPTEPIRDTHFEGVDIKGKGGQVVAPPSIHPVTNGRYKFIRPPKGDIPYLDLDELVFPNLKKRETGGATRGITRVTGEAHTDKPRFDFELIADGVDDGSRNTALVSYIGHLIWRGLSEEEIMALAMDWNGRNRPPLEGDELKRTVNYCYNKYAQNNAANAPVSTKTLAKVHSVLIETEPLPDVHHKPTLYTPDSPTPVSVNEGETEDPWETEHLHLPTEECGKRRSVLRKGREYLSVSFFCGRWSCARCGPFFRQRWVDHLVEKTKGVDIYAAEISKEEWGCIRKQINRLGADYVKIRVSYDTYKVVTDQPLEQSTSLSPEEIKPYLESAIPHIASRCPVSTSRGWEHHKKEKTKGDYEVVTTTWLPMKEQTEVAKELGARILRRDRWLAPEDVDEEKWAEDFKIYLEGREEELRMEFFLDQERIFEYLEQQYSEDKLYDNYGDKDLLHTMLASAG